MYGSPGAILCARSAQSIRPPVRLMRLHHSRTPPLCHGERIERQEVGMTARSTIHALGSLILASTFAAAAAVAQSFEVVHSFVPDEGSDPQAGIVQLPNGDFAGTTVGGIGTLFRMDARGVL